MAPATTDQNLLVGILALQMDFISREELIAGMQAWILAKQRPLAEHLEAVGALMKDHRRLLESLVVAHIQQHNDDPQQSLASVVGRRSIHEVLAGLSDPDVEVSLAQAVRQTQDERPTADPFATLSVDAKAPGTALARFRILRPHAEGGLGRVYVAHDEEVGREVALKEIRPERSDDDSSRMRFLLEAEITGGLEHPGIVPVYGLGTYADGRPFYAMRFIRGETLKQAIGLFHAAASKPHDPGNWNSESCWVALLMSAKPLNMPIAAGCCIAT